MAENNLSEDSDKEKAFLTICVNTWHILENERQK